MISVIVPAHNESSVIYRTLSAITTGATPSQLEVIVVCNGCIDDTARKAREVNFPIRVIETEFANKTNALNLGDKVALFFPRVYVDADVSVSFDILRGDVHAVAPRPHVTLAHCSRLVKTYYKLRARLPSSCEGIGGSGVYALSQAGRRRFEQFPNVTADDGFVRIHFLPQERETLPSVCSIVFAPRRIKDLLAVRTRAYFGSAELSRLYPDLWRNRGLSNNRALIALLKIPVLWPGLLLYLSVNGLARFKARSYMRNRRSIWQRDNTSRSDA
jgi:glycosyltransferase involved in cell wall biosynthesis